MNLFATPETVDDIPKWIDLHPLEDRVPMYVVMGMTWNYLAGVMGVKTVSRWVLTREHNDYDQYGEYYVMCWDHKPTVIEIIDIMETEECGYSVAHILAGGGRRNDTVDIWYNLIEETR